MSDELQREPTGDAAATEAVAVDAAAVDTGAVDTPVTDAPPAESIVVENPAVQADAPAAPVKVSRRPVAIAALRRLVMFTLTVVLFVGGIALGATTFQRTRPAPSGIDGSITVAGTPAAIAQEFIAALAANDADAMRSSLSPQPNKDLTDEFARFTIKRVTSVETLGTSVDGTRSATEILLRTEKDDGLPFEVNLVILVEGNTIEGFR
jgi:hypothetical protein